MPNEGITPPDFSGAVGQIRLLLGDTDAVPLNPAVAGMGEYVWFSDAELEAVATIYDGNVRRAAARLLLTIAGSQALLLKKWTTDDLMVDGAAIAEALRKQAATLMDEADTAAATEDIFVIGYPGSNKQLWPEGFPVPVGYKVGRAVQGYPGYDDDFGGYTQDGGLLFDD